MAQFMLSEAFAAAGLEDEVVVDSAGTTAYEAGRPIDPRAARILSAKKIPFKEHVAREWRRDWFRDRDLILALDVDHYGWLRETAPDEDARQKVRMLRSFDPAVADLDALDQGVDDPWYGGHTDFDNSWQLIRAAIPGVVEHVARQLEGRRISGPREEGPRADGERGDKAQRVRSIP
jgi:protein-tyrosine phosphatase